MRGMPKYGTDQGVHALWPLLHPETHCAVVSTPPHCVTPPHTPSSRFRLAFSLIYRHFSALKPRFLTLQPSSILTTLHPPNYGHHYYPTSSLSFFHPHGISETIWPIELEGQREFPCCCVTTSNPASVASSSRAKGILTGGMARSN